MNLGAITLGPFRLDQPVGRGGMGQVWAGRHARLGYPVAVKFLTARAVKKPGFLQAFRNEVRMVAALDHPGIVRVYDAGEADAETARATHDRIAPGTPWLAMELVRGGTLAPLGGRLAWEELAVVIPALLEALGHAHARGVVHRDLKPGNVLVVRDGRSASELVVKLTDFGLASEVEAQDGAGTPFAGGTPAYMAPEQFEGRWRDYGPWTDLYGAGCLFWSIVRGVPPFGATTTVEEKRRQHLNDPPPALEPPIAVPRGLEGWLRGLLEKDPARRFRRAADALAAFHALGPPDDGTQGPATPSPQSLQPTLLFDEATELDETTAPSDVPSGPPSTLPLTAASAHAPPVPADWRGGERDRGDPTPVGLGLFGLRQPPLVDRVPERDALWRALREVDRTGLVHAVVLEGPGGSGKSRLAEWLCQRAHETGAATILKASHAAIPGPTHGLGSMLKATLRCQGLDRPAIRDRVEQIFRHRGVHRPDEWEALTEVIQPADAGVRGAIRFASPVERYTTVRRLLQAMAQERPIVLWLDDAHLAADALRFALYLLDYPTRTTLPLLLAVTADDERPDGLRDEANLLSELGEHERTDRVGVGPLPSTHRADLVRGVLGLEPSLLGRVTDHTAGNPLFVVQLLGDWVQRGALEPTPDGFRMRSAEPLPRTVSELWAGRVERMLAARSAEEAHALELAATLGASVDPVEWGAACLLAPSAHPSDALLDQLLDQGLVRTGPDGPGSGWSFAHRTLRDALVARAAEGGRLPIWHRACAELLERNAGASGERVGRHWLGALQPERAIPPLLAGARDRVDGGDYAVAEELLDLYERALDGAGVPLADPRRAESGLLRHEAATRTGAWDRATAQLAAVEDAAARNGWPAVLGRARIKRARRERVAGRYDAARPLLFEVEADAARRGDRTLLAATRLEIGSTLLASGDVPATERWANLALREFELLRDREGVGSAWMLLADAAKEVGDHPLAMRLLGDAAARFEELGHRWKTADALNSMGDVARATGDHERALALYRRARGLFKAIGSKAWIYPEYNAAMVHVDRGDPGRARPVLERAIETFLEQGNRVALANAHLAMALVAGSEGRWILWDDHLGEAGTLLAESGHADEELARLALRVAVGAEGADQAARGARARELAHHLWSVLGRHDELTP